MATPTTPPLISKTTFDASVQQQTPPCFQLQKQYHSQRQPLSTSATTVITTTSHAAMPRLSQESHGIRAKRFKEDNYD
eukprot:Awhi_evm1s6432